MDQFPVHLVPSSDWDNMDRLFAGPIGAALMESVGKALEAGSGVDAASYTGGRALGYESLEAVLHSVTLGMADARLWQLLPKRSIQATIDQYTRRTTLGGSLGRWGMSAAESSNPLERVADLSRAFSQVRYYRDLRSVSDVSLLVRSTVNPEAEEEQAGMTNIVHAIGEDCYSGINSTANAVFPLRINGLWNIINNTTGATVVDLEGAKLTQREPFNQAMALIRNTGGRCTHAFMNPLLQEDFSTIYANAERVTLNANSGGLIAGAAITGVDTAQGRVIFEGDPFCIVGGAFPAAAVGDATTRPSAATLNSTTAGSSGGNIPAGDYFYRVTCVNENGESVSVASASTTVTAGQTVTLDMDPGVAGGVCTGFRIYRSAKDASDAADCRYLWAEVNAGAGTTFIDTGDWVPGTAHVALLDMRTEAHALQWSQLLPASRKDLAQTGPTRPFLCNLYGSLRVARPEWLGIIKNILPSSVEDAGWSPV